MLTIREYTLPKSGEVTLLLPGGADITFVKSHEGALRLYTMEDPESTVVMRTFVVLKTGESLPHGRDSIYPHGAAPVDGVMRHVVEVV